MDGGGRRQLPSWMRRCTNADQALTSQVKSANKANDSEEHGTKASKSRSEVQKKHNETEVCLLENKSQLLKKCESRRKKPIKQVEDQGNRIHEGHAVKKNGANLLRKCETRRGTQGTKQKGQGSHVYEDDIEEKNDVPLLRKCETRRTKRKSNKLDGDQGDNHDMEKKVDVVTRKRYPGNAPRKKQKAGEPTEENSRGELDSIQSDDELTVEDLVSIAKEYVKADEDEQRRHLNKMGLQSEKTTPQSEAFSEIGSEKNLIKDDIIPVTVKAMSLHSSSTEPSTSKGGIIHACTTSDPVQDMLDLFLGPLLKKTSKKTEKKTDVRTENMAIDYELRNEAKKPEEGEKKTDSLTDKIMLDYEFSKASHRNGVVEGVPAVKKKLSLKDQIAMLLD